MIYTNFTLFDKPMIPSELIVFSHLRWDFVFQRPQHLLTRLSSHSSVYFIEEPVFGHTHIHYEIIMKDTNLYVLIPHLPEGTQGFEVDHLNKQLLDQFLKDKDLDKCAFWYYTPMALTFSKHLNPAITIFDCMDELSAFKFAPPELKQLEKDLMFKSDLVFTGGHSLFQAKKHQHSNIFPFPSSIDKLHFGSARNMTTTPPDQQNIPTPKFGFYGVIDERFDIEMIREVATARPEWQFVLIGPVVKIDPETLPKNSNIFYLGGKNYNELPSYLASWDVAIIPFAINESTKFISPTKTPEYLSAGIPVISTPITDVISPYKEADLVEIASNAEEFIAAAEYFLGNSFNRQEWLTRVDSFLTNISWDATVAQMVEKIENTIFVKNTHQVRANN